MVHLLMEEKVVQTILKPRNGRYDVPSPVQGAEGWLVCVLRTGDVPSEDGILYLVSAESGENLSLGIRAPSGTMVRDEGLYRLIFPDSGEDSVLRLCVSETIPFDASRTETMLRAADSEWTSAWRDPQISRADGGWLLLCGAVRKGEGKGRRGCIARFYSSDLQNWQELPPLADNCGLSCAPGAPGLFTICGLEYLLYTALSDRVGTRYFFRRTGETGWHRPANDLLDSRAFLYGRSFAEKPDGILCCGILPSRDCDHWHYSPAGYMGHDYNTWDLGGSVLLHFLSAGEDGALLCRPVPQEDTVDVPLSGQPLNGNWVCSGDGLRAVSPGGAAHLLFDRLLPERCELALEVLPEDGCRRLGLMLFADEGFAEAYCLYIEPDRNRVQLRSPFRMTEDGSWAFPQEIELEQHYPASAGRAIRLVLRRNGPAARLWINGSCMSFRVEDRTFGRPGLSVSHGTAAWQRIRLSVPREDLPV